MSDKKLIDLLREASKVQKVVVVGVDVYVSPLTLAEQAKVNAMFPDADDNAKRQAAILILKCQDAEGRPLFASDDRDALASEVNAGAFTAVWAAINGNSVAAQAEK